jgi:signal transduction histidine kinase
VPAIDSPRTAEDAGAAAPSRRAPAESPRPLAAAGTPATSATASVWRSVTFRLGLIYVVVFGASVTLLLGFIYLSTAGLMQQQTEDTIEAEIRVLAERYRLTRLDGLVRSINERIERNPFSSNIYLLVSPRNARVAGNLDRWPREPPDAEGWLEFALEQVGGQGEVHQARARSFVLPGDFHLLVGRDMFEVRATEALIARTLTWGVVITALLALAGAVMMSRSTARRLEVINATSRRIMRGDLSQRVPTRGTRDEFDQLAANLNGMLDQIQQLMDGVRHVSDNVAHDLRTPLTRLRNRLEGLSRGGGESREEAEQALVEADGMLATFNALLRIARIEAGARREAFTEVPVDEVVSDAAELYEAVAEDKDIRLEVNVGAQAKVVGDRDLIFQALANLLDNAIKYTPAGGVVELSLTRGESGVRVRVADSGPGIPQHEHGRVFERFIRLEDSRSTRGNGLGLSLVAAVAKLHGARVRFDDAEPGLVVNLDFPDTI